MSSQLLIRRHYMMASQLSQENYILATYYVSSTSSATKILGDNFDIYNLNNISKIERVSSITNHTEVLETLSSVGRTHKFSTTGYHTLKIYFSKLTSLANMFRWTGTDEQSNTVIPVYQVSLVGAKLLKVTTMDSMFRGATNLTTIYTNGVKSLNTSNVTSLSNILAYCYNLDNSINSFIKAFSSTSKVTTLDRAFYSCCSNSKLSSLDVSGWTTPSVTSMTWVFSNTLFRSIYGLDSWDTTNVTTFESMFHRCVKLEYVPKSTRWVAPNCISTKYMFYRVANSDDGNGEDTVGVTNLGQLGLTTITGENANEEPIGISGNLIPKSGKVQTAYGMFSRSGFSSISEGDNGTTNLTSFFVENRSTLTDLYDLFARMPLLKIVNFDNELKGQSLVLSSAPVINAGRMFWNCFSLQHVLGLSFTPGNNSDGYGYVDATNMFMGDTALKTCRVSLNNHTLSSYSSSSYKPSIMNMFYGCSSLEYVHDFIGSGYEGNVGDSCVHVNQAFYGCSSLKSLGEFLDGISPVTNGDYTYGVFQGCSSLQSVDMSTWDLTMYSKLDNMFHSCTSLSSITFPSDSGRGYIGRDLAGTPSIYMRYFLYNCSSLTEVNNFNNLGMGYVTYLNYAFAGCSNITSWDLRGKDLSNVRTFEGMFRSNTSLVKVYMDSELTGPIVTNMFYGITTNGTFYCDSSMTYYDSIIDVLPATWNVEELSMYKGSLTLNISTLVDLPQNYNSFGLSSAQALQFTIYTDDSLTSTKACLFTINPETGSYSSVAVNVPEQSGIINSNKFPCKWSWNHQDNGNVFYGVDALMLFAKFSIDPSQYSLNVKVTINHPDIGSYPSGLVFTSRSNITSILDGYGIYDFVCNQDNISFTPENLEYMDVIVDIEVVSYTA